MKRMITIFSFLYLILVMGPSFAQVKQADKAGSWYPASPSELSKMLDTYLEQATPKSIKGDIVGIISPHAGYTFSAPVAAYGYKLLKNRGIKTAIVIGFNHSMYHDGIAVCDYEAYKTPLGTVPINMEITKQLSKQSTRIYSLRTAFHDEQSTEMQIPFLQTVLDNFSIVVISMGEQSIENCKILADALYEVLKDKNNYILVGSTDLSHYLPYDENNELDKYTISVLKQFEPEALFYASSLKKHQLMCGLGPTCATMMACKKLGANDLIVLKHANSGDVYFDKSRVVGYLSAAIVKTSNTKSNARETKEGEKDMLNQEQRQQMLKLARDTITLYLKEGSTLEVKDDDPILNEEMGAFVTLHKHGQLRGCIGNMVGRGPFYLTVRNMAIQAATGDPRFRPVSLDEMKDIDIEISALSPMEKITDPNIIEAGKHGVLVKQGFRSGVYLPQVATETGWDREQFMTSLCGNKAGIAPDAWKKGTCEIYVFTAEVFGEKE